MLTQQQLLKLVSSLGACLSSTAAKLSDASDRMRSGHKSYLPRNWICSCKAFPIIPHSDVRLCKI